VVEFYDELCCFPGRTVQNLVKPVRKKPSRSRDMKPTPPECDAKVLTAMAVTFDMNNE